MGNKISAVALLIAAGTMLALPATGAAESKRCKKTPKVGFTVSGTLVSLTADDPNSEAFEGSATITVTEANGPATKSGEIADQDGATEGTQVAGATYAVSGDAYKLVLEEFEAPDTPSPGDAVQIIGKAERTKAKCAPEGTTVEDRTATPDIRKVVVTDMDGDV
jgi:hypothetical protein